MWDSDQPLSPLLYLGIFGSAVAVVLWPVNVLIQVAARLLWPAFLPNTADIPFWEYLAQVSWRMPLSGVTVGLLLLVTGMLIELMFIVPSWINSVRYPHLSSSHTDQAFVDLSSPARSAGKWIAVGLCWGTSVLLILTQLSKVLVLTCLLTVYAVTVYVLILHSNRRLGAAALYRARALVAPFVVTDILACLLSVLAVHATGYVGFKIEGSYRASFMDSGAEMREVVAQWSQLSFWWIPGDALLRAATYSTLLALGVAWILPMLYQRDLGSLAAAVLTLLPAVGALLPAHLTGLGDAAAGSLATIYREIPLPVAMAAIALFSGMLIEAVKSRLPSALVCSHCNAKLRPSFRYCPQCSQPVVEGVSPKSVPPG